MRLWSLSRPHELGAEWDADDMPKGMKGTIAIDMDRESFMWAIVWSPPAKLAVSYIEQRDEGPYYHEALRPIKELGKEFTFEDAREEAEKAIERVKVKVAELKLEERVPPEGKAPKRAKRR